MPFWENIRITGADEVALVFLYIQIIHSQIPMEIMDQVSAALQQRLFVKM